MKQNMILEKHNHFLSNCDFKSSLHGVFFIRIAMSLKYIKTPIIIFEGKWDSHGVLKMPAFGGEYDSMLIVKTVRR